MTYAQILCENSCSHITFGLCQCQGSLSGRRGVTPSPPVLSWEVSPVLSRDTPAPPPATGLTGYPLATALTGVPPKRTRDYRPGGTPPPVVQTTWKYYLRTSYTSGKNYRGSSCIFASPQISSLLFKSRFFNWRDMVIMWNMKYILGVLLSCVFDHDKSSLILQWLCHCCVTGAGGWK